MKIHIVLHQSIYPSNIGSCVRAMGNMGAERLILVDPQCEINSQAQRAAVGCQSTLQGRTTYKSWDEFYKNEGEGIRVGFTARAGKLRPALEAETLFAELKETKETETQNLYLIFGREDSGLSAEDVELCHHTCTLQTHGEYSSLNLSQAVLLGLYVVRRFFPLKKIEETQEVEPLFYPQETIKEWLETLGFDLSAPTRNAFKTMNQLILRNRPTHKELKILHAVLNQNIRKLKEHKTGE